MSEMDYKLWEAEAKERALSRLADEIEEAKVSRAEKDRVVVVLDREQAEKLAQDYGTADGAEDCGCPACRIAKDVRAALRKQPAEKLAGPDQAQDSLPVEEGDGRPSTDSCPYCGKDDCQSVEHWRDQADHWWRVAEEWADRATDQLYEGS